MDALQKQLALEADHFPLLGGLQGSHQGLEDVGTAVVVEQHPELHAGLPTGICKGTAIFLGTGHKSQLRFNDTCADACPEPGPTRQSQD